MRYTELTVCEWKFYLKDQLLPEWKQPSTEWSQTDEHPVVNVSWGDSKRFCEWLSAKTGKEWRLPTSAEWDAASGRTTYPWGDYFPPHWDDGNYSTLDNGKNDPNLFGNAGIRGTAPVASFKPNELGFYDIGGNVFEWIWEVNDHERCPIVRGGGWNKGSREFCRVASKWGYPPQQRNDYSDASRGFRLVRVTTTAERHLPDEKH